MQTDVFSADSVDNLAVEMSILGLVMIIGKAACVYCAIGEAGKVKVGRMAGSWHSCDPLTVLLIIRRWHQMYSWAARGCRLLLSWRLVLCTGRMPHSHGVCHSVSNGRVLFLFPALPRLLFTPCMSESCIYRNVSCFAFSAVGRPDSASPVKCAQHCCQLATA